MNIRIRINIVLGTRSPQVLSTMLLKTIVYVGITSPVNRG